MELRTLSIVVPAYNEAATIHKILDRIKEVDLANGMVMELVIVNQKISS